MEQKIKDTIQRLKTRGVITKAGMWQGTKEFADYDMFVLYNEVLVFDIPETEYKLMVETKADQPWSEVHFQERISGRPLNPGESYKIWPYNKFKDGNDPYMEDGQIFSHTYMERFYPKYASTRSTIPMAGIRYNYGDLLDVIMQLHNNHLTRQAYLPIFYPEDTGALKNQRVPCTIGYYFFIINGQLHCNYTIRSCDAFRHFRNDIYLTGRLMQYVASKLDISCGKLTMYIFNLHFFKNDLYALTMKENKL